MRLTLSLFSLILSITLISSCGQSRADSKTSGGSAGSVISGSWKINKAPCKALSFMKKNSVLVFSEDGKLSLKAGGGKSSRVIASGTWTQSGTEKKPSLTLEFTKMNDKFLTDRDQKYISGELVLTDSNSQFSLKFACQGNPLLCMPVPAKFYYLKGKKINS
ncbi:MAG: hypothetical protein OEZ36_01245 [Spirochaetota bacterium]|nr:hypothetical protein [Spirochaetota bacterium]